MTLTAKIEKLMDKAQNVSIGVWTDCGDLLASLRGETEGPTGNPVEKISEDEAREQYRELLSQYEESKCE